MLGDRSLGARQGLFWPILAYFGLILLLLVIVRTVTVVSHGVQPWSPILLALVECFTCARQRITYDFVPSYHACVTLTGLLEGREASGERAEEAASLGRSRRAQAGDEQGCFHGGGSLDCPCPLSHLSCRRRVQYTRSVGDHIIQSQSK